MCIYQRYLSKSLIFFSIFFVIFLLFIESNIGFKLIFNFTNRIFIGLQAEQISGNWRDFTLKNIKYNDFGVSIQANSLHIILDTRSLFKISTVFKKIETKNLIITFKKNISTNLNKKHVPIGIMKNNIFIKYPIIFQKIHADKIFFKTPKVDIFFFNVFSSIELIQNNIVILPTYIDTVRVVSSYFNFNKKDKKNKSTIIKNINNLKNKNHFSYFFSSQPKIFIPLNINLVFLKCKKIYFLHHKKFNMFEIEFKAKVIDSVLKIKKLQINSSLLKIKSYGTVIFNKNYSISCVIHNKILMPQFNNKYIVFLFKANLYNKFKFKLQSENIYKININGTVLLDSSNYPFYIKLKGKDLFWSIKKDFVLKLNTFNGLLKGKINNYSLSLDNILSIPGIPSIFIKINGKGNLKTIFLKKIKLSPIKIKKIHQRIIHEKNNIKYYQYILKLMGKINAVGKSYNNIYNLYVPKINLDGYIMKKKISILGSVYYKNFHFLEIPRINLFSGNNKLYVRGSLGNTCNIYSDLDANNLDYFLPNLQGRIKAKINCYGNYMHPFMTSTILADNLNWNSIYLKSIKIFANTNIKDILLGKVLVNSKKINISKFHINSLRLQANWNHQRQKFDFLLKSHKLYINLTLHGIINDKTGNWNGFFKKINIKTAWGKIVSKKSSITYHSDCNNDINKFYKNNIKIVDIFSFFLHKTKTAFLKIFNQSLINFKSEISVHTKLKWMSGKNIPNIKMILTGNNIKLEKKTPGKTFHENVDYLRLSIDLIKNLFKSKWIVKKTKNSLEKINSFGYLNVLDIYNKKNMNGKFIINGFPVSLINFFTTNFKEVQGTFTSNVQIFGSLYQPRVSADVNFQNVFVRSDNILKYLSFFFPYFLGKTDAIKINQEIIMKKGNISFTLNPYFKKCKNIEWNLLFSSNKIGLVIFPKVKIKFSSELNLQYLLEKYNLIGYLKFSFFYFKINEKNFIF